MCGRYQLAAVIILSLFTAMRVANSATTEPASHEAPVSEPAIQFTQLYPACRSCQRVCGQKFTICMRDAQWVTQKNIAGTATEIAKHSAPADSSLTGSLNGREPASTALAFTTSAHHRWRCCVPRLGGNPLWQNGHTQMNSRGLPRSWRDQAMVASHARRWIRGWGNVPEGTVCRRADGDAACGLRAVA